MLPYESAPITRSQFNYAAWSTFETACRPTYFFMFAFIFLYQKSKWYAIAVAWFPVADRRREGTARRQLLHARRWQASDCRSSMIRQCGFRFIGRNYCTPRCLYTWLFAQVSVARERWRRPGYSRGRRSRRERFLRVRNAWTFVRSFRRQVLAFVPVLTWRDWCHGHRSPRRTTQKSVSRNQGLKCLYAHRWEFWKQFISLTKCYSRCQKMGSLYVSDAPNLLAALAPSQTILVNLQRFSTPPNCENRMGRSIRKRKQSKEIGP